MKRETAEGGLARRLAALNAARCAALTGWENLMEQNTYVSRSDGRTVGCPYCGAQPGAKCERYRGGPREANHRERIQAYVGTRLSA